MNADTNNQRKSALKLISDYQRESIRITQRESIRIIQRESIYCIIFTCY